MQMTCSFEMYGVKWFLYFFIASIWILENGHGLENIVDYYENIFNECYKKMSKYEFPKDNSDFFSEASDKTVHDYGTFDFIIIGAGSSGAVIANRLTEIADWNVLLIEAGGQEDDASDVPGFFQYLQSSRMNWGYLTSHQTTCCLGMKNNQCIYPRGKVLGGSSSINALMYVRGNPRDYDLWEELGNKGWNYENALYYFRKSENSQIYFDDFHGNDGPLNVEYPEPPSELLQTFIDGNNELGRENLDYNGRYQIGYSRTQMNVKHGKRVSGGNAFVVPIKQRNNINVSLNSLVTKILTKTTPETVAYGVEFIKNGMKYRALASKEVILSAGTVNSPHILKLSGIGPKEELAKFNIPVVNDLPMVGKNFKDHLRFLGLNFHTNFTQKDDGIRALIKDYLKGRGILATAAPTYAIGFIETKDQANGVPDVEYIFLPPSPLPYDLGVVYNYNDDLIKYYSENTKPLSDMSINLMLLHPKSSGEIRLKSGDPKDFPEIDVNYFSDDENQDLETLYQGILFIMNLTNSAAFRKIDLELYVPDLGCGRRNDGDSRGYWYCILRHLTSTFYHPTGTTKMGRSREDSVVNSNLIVHNMKNLRVADAGVIPTTISGHTNAPAFMIGERISDLIKMKYGKL